MSNNIYKKLQHCRVALKKLPIKESGNNKFAGYTYMELGDFLPHIVDLCEEHGLCTVVSFGEIATLTVVNTDAPEESIVFASPMSTADLKGCHAIQNLGAVETYLRRYLYVNAFDIVEHDALDSTQGKKETRQEGGKSGAETTTASLGNTPGLSEAQTTLIAELGGYCGGNQTKMVETLKEVSHYKTGDKEGFLKMDDLKKKNDNDKFQRWVGSALGNLRKKTKGEDK
jgi:hypothetical protein